MDILIFTTILISPILWLVSIFLTIEWIHFKKLALINLVIHSAKYALIFVYSSK